MNDRKLLASAERQTQFEQTTVRIHHQRERVDSDGTAFFELHFQNYGHLEQDSLTPSPAARFDGRTQYRVSEEGIVVPSDRRDVFVLSDVTWL